MFPYLHDHKLGFDSSKEVAMMPFDRKAAPYLAQIFGQRERLCSPMNLKVGNEAPAIQRRKIDAQVTYVLNFRVLQQCCLQLRLKRHYPSIFGIAITSK